jgi:fatty-acyl-CoA synthase
LTSPVPSRAPSATIAGAVDAVAARTPSAPAAWFPTSRSTYAELAESSMLSARRLRGAGIRPGDRVGILLSEVREEYVSTSLAGCRLGALVVPVNARYKARELRYLVDHAGLNLLYTTADFQPLIEAAGVRADCRVVILEDSADFVARGDAIGVEEVLEQEHAVDIDAPARLIYTSGTTAHPKACLHTQRALLAQGVAVAERIELTARDVFWTPLQMFHVAGWATMLAAQARGACFSHVGFFTPDAALDQLERDRCTVIFPSFETIWMAVLKHPGFEDADLSAARLVINVGIPERMQMMQEKFPHAKQVSITGSSEACGFLSIGKAEDPLESRIRTGGLPLPGMEVRIVDPETKEDLPPGTPGELLFRGVWRFSEYYNDPEATAAAIDGEGWFHSGDLMRLDPDGSLSFVSRLKDMLKVGGENVAAAEIEGFLLTHLAVHMVQVVAAPDARYGEVPAAFVEREPGTEATEEELIAFCIDEIATFKIPRYVRFVQEWPMSGTKVQKFVLRERIAEELRTRGIREAPRVKAGR